jgi:3D (Asp-Asp-Asp) domain-containing protein
MENAKLITNLLLAAATLSVAHHSTPAPSVPTSSMTIFLAKEGKTRTHRPVIRTAHKKEAAKTLVYTVTATAYQPVENQTDDEPFVTADNSNIKPQFSSKTHWMALSRDLLARWGGDFQYGDQVVVSGISPQLDGVYTVHDTMNRRHHHCMDILTHAREKIDICTKNVKVQLIAATASPDSSRNVSEARATSLARLRSGAAARASSPDLLMARGKNKRIDYFASAIL